MESLLRGWPTLDSSLLATNDDRFQEFVILVLGVSLLDRLHGIGALLALTLDDTGHSNFHSIPSLVAIHDVVSPYHGGQLSDTQFLGLLEKLSHVFDRRLGIGISSVTEEVDEHFGDADLFRDLQKTEEMLDVRVHTAVGD